MTEIDLTNTASPSEAAPEHVWGPMPPGQGRSTDRVCAKCGCRMSVVGATSSCYSMHRDAVAETLHTYDPFKED